MMLCEVIYFVCLMLNLLYSCRFISESVLALQQQASSTSSSSSMDMIIPCYNGIHCNNFLLNKLQLTPTLYMRQVDNVINMSHLSNTSYWYNHAYYLKNYNNIAVVAGHFRWQVWLHLDTYVQQFMNLSASSLSDSPTYEYVPPDDIPPPKCMVIGRHPVSRFISYYYQRCFGTDTCFGKYYMCYIDLLCYDEFIYVNIYRI